MRRATPFFFFSSNPLLYTVLIIELAVTKKKKNTTPFARYFYARERDCYCRADFDDSFFFFLVKIKNYLVTKRVARVSATGFRRMDAMGARLHAREAETDRSRSETAIGPGPKIPHFFFFFFLESLKRNISSTTFGSDIHKFKTIILILPFFNFFSF